MGQNCCGFCASVSEEDEKCQARKTIISGKTSRKKRQPTLASAQRQSVKKKVSGKKEKKKKAKSKKIVKTPPAKKKLSVLSKQSAAKSKSSAIVPSKLAKTSTSDCSRQKSTNSKKIKNMKKNSRLHMSKITSIKSNGPLVSMNSKLTSSQVILASNTTEKSQGTSKLQNKTFSTASSLQSVNEIFTLAAGTGSLASVISLATNQKRVGETECSVKLPKEVTFREDLPLKTTDILLLLTGTTLLADQSLQTTLNGQKVNRSIVTRVRRMFSALELEKMRQNQLLSADINVVLYPPYSIVDRIVPGLYLCGFSGTTKESLQQTKINLLVNVTWELPLLKVQGLTAYRVPVDDTPEETIGRYFEEVSDLLEANRRVGRRSMVHCLAGVSRSATLVLAYLLKYTTLNLHQAFVHLHSARPCIRPNMGFFKQLIDWEVRLRGVASTQMVSVARPVNSAKDHEKDTSPITVLVPDFYPTEYPKLVEAECSKQMKVQQKQRLAE